MPCFHPRALLLGDPSDGSEFLDIRSDYFEYLKYYDEFKLSYGCEPVVRRDGFCKPVKQVLKMPCGECLGCAQLKALEWTGRCFYESISFSKKKDFNGIELKDYFLTLTYSDENVRTGIFGTREKPYIHAILNYEDVSSFLKRLRRFFKYYLGYEGFKYFCGSEYGSRGHRPHYHLILFHVPDLDKIKLNFKLQYHETKHKFCNFNVVTELDKCYQTTKNFFHIRQYTERSLNNNLRYYSELSHSSHKLRGYEFLNYLWGHGATTLSVATSNTMFYCAAYCNKKFFQLLDHGGYSCGDDYLFEYPPKLTMSKGKNNGLAYDYFQEHKEELFNQSLCVPNPKGGAPIQVPLSRSFLVKLKELYPERYAQFVVEQAEKAQAYYHALYEARKNKDLDFYNVISDILLTLELNFNAKVNGLRDFKRMRKLVLDNRHIRSFKL